MNPRTRTQTCEVFECSEKVCGKKLIDEPEGVILSPNYPVGYPKYLNCRYQLRAPPDNRIELHLDEFNIQASEGCDKDYLEGTEPGIAGIEAWRWCGERSAQVYVTRSNILDLNFRTDGSVVHSEHAAGFRISFSFLYVPVI